MAFASAISGRFSGLESADVVPMKIPDFQRAQNALNGLAQNGDLSEAFVMHAVGKIDAKTDAAAVAVITDVATYCGNGILNAAEAQHYITSAFSAPAVVAKELDEAFQIKQFLFQLSNWKPMGVPQLPGIATIDEIHDHHMTFFVSQEQQGEGLWATIRRLEHSAEATLVKINYPEWTKAL